MRSRSTLLSHILGSNDAICGYRELLRSYESRIDFFRLRTDLFRDTGSHFKGKFLLDKILHNHHGIDPRLFPADRTRIIYLVREPASTLKSIVNMSQRLRMDRFTTPAEALEHYAERLGGLADSTEVLNFPSYFLASEQLVDDPDETLGALSEWLGLDEPLGKSYKVFDRTGQAGFGDPFENIKRGTITRTPDHDIEIPSDVLEKAWSAHSKAFAELKTRCLNSL
mgnify:CR=1 FL=1